MIKGNVSAETIGAILDRLATDDAFREQMLGDPQSALAPYGLEIDMSQMPAVRKLPSKEEISAAKQDLASQISNDSAYMILLLK